MLAAIHEVETERSEQNNCSGDCEPPSLSLPPTRTDRLPIDSLSNNWGQEPITALRNGLDVGRLPRIVFEDSTQFGNGARQHFLGDKGFWPYLTKNMLLGENIPGLLGQGYQYLHDLGFDVDRAPVTLEAVQLRSHSPLPDPESAGQTVLRWNWAHYRSPRQNAESFVLGPLQIPETESLSIPRAKPFPN